MDALLNLILVTPYALVIVPVVFGVLMLGLHMWMNGRY